MSIAEARARIAEVVRRAERGEIVELTRRGRPVAIVRAPADESGGDAFLAAVAAWRARMRPEDFLERDHWDAVRDRAPARDFDPFARRPHRKPRS